MVRRVVWSPTWSGSQAQAMQAAAMSAVARAAKIGDQLNAPALLLIMMTRTP